MASKPDDLGVADQKRLLGRGDLGAEIGGVIERRCRVLRAREIALLAADQQGKKSGCLWPVRESQGVGGARQLVLTAYRI